MSSIIYFVRHGENRANITKEFSYRKIDYPLTARGILQARQTADYFRGKHVDAIFTSPLRRATETAEILGETLELNIQVVEALREINVGILEDQPPSDEAWARHDQIAMLWREGQYEIRFPGGEDYFTLLARMRHGLTQILTGRDRQHLVVVGHGGILTATVQDLCLDAHEKGANYRHIPNCAVSEMEMSIENDTIIGRLVSWASTSHLDEETGSLP